MGLSKRQLERTTWGKVVSDIKAWCSNSQYRRKSFMEHFGKIDFDDFETLTDKAIWVQAFEGTKKDWEDRHGKEYGR